jgi:hypothetical protein
MLGHGDWNSIVEQYAKEVDKGEGLGIEKVLQRGEQPEEGSAGVKPAPNGNPAKVKGT